MEKVPHWSKIRIYNLFVHRWQDLDWTVDGAESYSKCLLRGIPKEANPSDLDRFRWLGLMGHLYKLYEAWVIVW